MNHGSAMNIKIVGRKVNLRDNFKQLVEKKLAKFDRVFDEDAEAVVTVTLEKNRQTVEITIRQRGMIYRAEATSVEMNEALDIVVGKLSNQIHRNKKKLENAKKVGSFELSVEDEETSEEPEEEFSVVRTKKFFVKTMSVEEAILQMNLLEHEFFMFRDENAGEICVVYKRKNGDYGLLEPSAN